MTGAYKAMLDIMIAVGFYEILVCIGYILHEPIYIVWSRFFCGTLSGK